MMFSIVIPVYKCSSFILELNKRVVQAVTALSEDFEIIYINDASPENDWELIKILSEKDNRIKGINFSKNFGQHKAIIAGLQHTSGNWVVVMDGDLQDQPEEIANLYFKALEGYDIVLAKRAKRKDKFFKKWFSGLFYKVLGFFTNSKFDSSIGNFGIFNEKIISALLEFKGQVRTFRFIVGKVGFRKTAIEVKHNERPSGKSAYNYRKLFIMAFEIIISHSNKPLILTVILGFLISFISFVMGAIYLYKYFAGLILVSGYTSLILSIWFLSGVTIFSIGIVGIYIGKIFNELKNPPLFIIDSTIGNLKKEKF
ncbi:MAG TPA: glycosyltransferase [Bacteroidales bacterium]|nr:glycosyltransferase [Bacteroidales bacterium]